MSLTPNKHSAKRFYSFTRAARFLDSSNKQYSSHSSTENYYEVPSTFSKRSPSFGFGTKFDFTSLSRNNPAPNSYNVSSSPALCNGFSFGVSREDSQKRMIEGHFQADLTIPGPGSYSHHPVIGLEGRKFTIKGKIEERLSRQNNGSPGPSAYSPMYEKAVGKYVLSTDKNSGFIAFSPKSLCRFPRLKDADGPGPGSYGTPLPRTKGSGRFSAVSSRGAFPYIASSTPGPGAYTLPCEFGNLQEMRTSQA